MKYDYNSRAHSECQNASWRMCKQRKNRKSLKMKCGNGLN